MFDESYNSGAASKAQLLRFLESSDRVKGVANGSQELLLEDGRTPHAESCPPTESMMRLANGTAASEEAAQLLEHASFCADCASILSGSLSALEGNPSQEETAAIAELASSKMEWRRQKARELAATPAKARPFLAHPIFREYRRWLPATAIAASLLLGLGFWSWYRAANAPEHQLALAYQESRTLELRVPQAGFAALTAGGRTRGAFNEPESSSLLEARARLSRELERSPQDSHWLQLQARADVLEERYGQAIDVLDRLRAQGPVTADLLGDLATAYYQRGLISGSEVDRSTALDYLRQADKLAPADPVILFNEAIVMEDRGQIMNAVEVWTRYITLEQDAAWKAEGQRKLTTLEQTLNRLKTHDSRVREMLATPQAMRALAADRQKLAAFDEELSSYQLDKLLLAAFPERGAGAKLDGSQQSRGSPCSESCQAARTLLQVVGNSLILEHHDFWLTDLVTPYTSGGPGEIPSRGSDSFAAGLRLLATAVAANINGSPIEAARFSLDAGKVFEQSGKSGAQWHLAAHVAGRRAAVEYLYALQRHVEFQGCRAAAAKLRHQPENAHDQARYPWIAAQALITEKVCDETPETRNAGRVLGQTAGQIANDEHYSLLTARVNVMMTEDAADGGDLEAAMRLVLPTLRDLYAGDKPSFRIFNALAAMGFHESLSPRSYSGEMYLQEMLEWAVLRGSPVQIAQSRAALACAEIRNGETKAAAEQLRLTDEELSEEAAGKGEAIDFRESSEEIANAMLETGDLPGAAQYLDRAAKDLSKSGDLLIERRYAIVRGQLALSQGHGEQSIPILEQAIRLSEGAKVRKADQATNAEFAQLDHDAYAVLSAAWLAQGRNPESILALWERFRLRSRGLPITQCRGDALDCEQPLLAREESNLGDNLLVGQILLPDRVLVYRVDRNGATWATKPLRKRNLLKAAQALEQAVSSPYTSSETASRLGEGLPGELLPELPATQGWQGLLLLEPDPMLENLSWPVLPTPSGPLGLTYPVEELQSILAPTRSASIQAGDGDLLAQEARALVVGASEATEGEPPLPEALSEAQDVSRMLHARALLAGDRATAPRVAQALGSATVFHFAGHAVQTAQGTELLLAAASPGDKTPWIDGSFLRQHPPKVCRLAVLSACATGSREASWNHPLQDMVQTLGVLGVPEVVATRWQIDSSSAVPFMDTFYRNLTQGKSAALALLMARRVQSGQPAFKNPYYWGAYYVAGREASNPIGELHAHL